VWVNNEEIVAIAAVVGEQIVAFEDKYVRKVGARKSLREFANGDCVFLNAETRGCGVYSARPRQCKTWPFWESNLKTPADWAHTCSVCPGSGKGKLHQLEEIETQRKVMKV
jgi:Fe-S-cluster containining protein